MRELSTTADVVIDLRDRVRPVPAATRPHVAGPNPAVALQTVDLEIVVPALNEERRLGATLRAVDEQLAALAALVPLTARLTVVDNGSCDRTSEVVDAYTGQTPARVIGCRQRGKGAAVRRGILASDARWVGFVDADGSTPASALARVLEELRGGAPAVIASRRVEGAVYARRQPLLRRTGSRVFHSLTRSMTGGISDTQCGFKFFDRDVAVALFQHLVTPGFAFDVELLAVAHAHGVPVTQVAVRWTDSDGSTLRPGADSVRIFGDVVRARRHVRRTAHRTTVPAVARRRTDDRTDDHAIDLTDERPADQHLENGQAARRDVA